MDDPQTHAKWKKPDTKHNILFHLYDMSKKRQKKKKPFREEVD